jgi:putative oxidoreductase
MKRSLVVELIVALLILLFVYTATSKFLEFSSFRYVLSRSPLIGQSAPVVAWALPITEYAISLLLFFHSTRRIGLWASFALMLVFTGYIGYMLAFSPHLPCSCGGVIKEMSWKQHLVFNIFYTLLALAGIWLHRKSLRSMKTPQTVFS